MKLYDVIVIGAGPAGAYSAKLLAEKKLNVLLLEKQSVPRKKPCAAGLPPHIDDILDIDYQRVINKISDQTVFTFNLKKPVLLRDEKVKIKMTMRPEFDALLVEKAIEAGAEFKEKMSVSRVEEEEDFVAVSAGKEKYYSKFVIGADGAYSIAAKNAGLLNNRIFGWAINAEVYVSDIALEKQGTTVNVEMGLVKEGYAWIFPKNDHLSCGLGTNKIKYPGFKNLMYDFIKKKIEAGSIKNIELKGHPLPHSYSRDLKINTNRLLLTGDAASLVEPLSGEGIYYALKSAVIAAKHIEKKNNENSYSFDEYSREINFDIRNELYYAGRFANIFYKFPKFTFDYGVANSLVNQKFQDLLLRKITYKEMYEILKPIYSNKFINPAVKIIDAVKKKIENNYLKKKINLVNFF